LYRVRDKSMRALIVSLALAVVVVICMAVVVLFAGLNASSVTLAGVGLGIFMVAALFAAIAALGPKARPTPLLTPTIAGTSAAALATVAVIVGTSQFGQAQRAAMRTGEPVKVTAPAPDIAAAPAPEQPQTAPEAIQFPGITIVPAGPLPRPAATTTDVDVPPAKAPEPSAPEPTEQAAPVPLAEPEIANAAPDTRTADPSPITAPADPAPQEPVANTAPSAPPTATPIPIPPIPTPPPAWLVLSEDVYDTSKPPALRSRTDGASPPLPRSRPCGADGPPCP
jgi:hypothetical protein